MKLQEFKKQVRLISKNHGVKISVTRPWRDVQVAIKTADKALYNKIEILIDKLSQCRPTKYHDVQSDYFDYTSNIEHDDHNGRSLDVSIYQCQV